MDKDIHLPVDTPYKLLHASCCLTAVERFVRMRHAVGTDVHEHFVCVALGMDQSRLRRQHEGAQPERVELCVSVW